MKTEEAVFVFTGEVVGQRPMTQHKHTLRLIEKRSGLEGLLLRPLSAKLLEPTIPEIKGIVNREHLLDLQGRGRKYQKELALRFGISQYPPPGGGCVLTDKYFGKKFNDLAKYKRKEWITLQDLNSLLTGRHFRLDSGMKIIVGRTEVENDFLMNLLSHRCWVFEARDFNGASVFSLDTPDEEDFLQIAAITARYGKGSHEESVVVIAKKEDKEKELKVKPACRDDIKRLLVCE